ncbi:MAG: chitobiase/beta-hexosaminidase C-terminal domain-containing protein [Candidatus Falkowbacteria bacterium]
MKISRILSVSVLGLFLAVSGASAWTIDNGINNNSNSGTTAYEPAASPAAGTYTSSQSVSLSASGASSIRYTTDGSTPSCTSGIVYSSDIYITSSQTIRAISCYLDNGSTSASNVISHTYTINISSGGGGGGGSVTYCNAVTFDNWQSACAGGFQFRNVLTQTPNNCTLTTDQQLARQRTCTVTTAPVTSPEISGATSTTVSSGNLLNNILDEAQILDTKKIEVLLNHLGGVANPAIEQGGLSKYKVILGLDKALNNEEKLTVNNFIVYGTLSTKRLGAGERAGVINSYYQAYNKMPNTEAEWSDVLKIASGRWPSERSAAAEAQAKVEFKRVYARSAVMTSNIDENAIMVIAYGLLPLERNLISEKTAIKTFKWVYGHAPVSALSWNVVRAIAYSGAAR